MKSCKEDQSASRIQRFNCGAIPDDVLQSWEARDRARSQSQTNKDMSKALPLLSPEQFAEACDALLKYVQSAPNTGCWASADTRRQDVCSTLRQEKAKLMYQDHIMFVVKKPVDRTEASSMTLEHGRHEDVLESDDEEANNLCA